MKIVQILLAIFLPPVAVFMVVGLTMHFWISLVLTLLGGLPGVIHGLLVVLAPNVVGIEG